VIIDERASIPVPMNNRTIRVIIFLVSLLFLNIEAAQAGLIHKLKIYIRHEFTEWQLIYILGGMGLFGILSYIIFTPVLIGSEKWAWYKYFTFNPVRPKYQDKRHVVKKIAGILTQKG
jgi:hypothetical protein